MRWVFIWETRTSHSRLGKWWLYTVFTGSRMKLSAALMICTGIASVTATIFNPGRCFNIKTNRPTCDCSSQGNWTKDENTFAAYPAKRPQRPQRSQRSSRVPRTWPGSLISLSTLFLSILLFVFPLESCPYTSNATSTLPTNNLEVVWWLANLCPLWELLAAPSVRKPLGGKRTRFPRNRSRTFPRTPLYRTRDHCLKSSRWLPRRLSRRSRRRSLMSRAWSVCDLCRCTFLPPRPLPCPRWTSQRGRQDMWALSPSTTLTCSTRRRSTPGGWNHPGPRGRKARSTEGQFWWTSFCYECHHH